MIQKSRKRIEGLRKYRICFATIYSAIFSGHRHLLRSYYIPDIVADDRNTKFKHPVLTLKELIVQLPVPKFRTSEQKQ